LADEKAFRDVRWKSLQGNSNNRSNSHSHR